jgi:hypothetical protein
MSFLQQRLLNELLKGLSVENSRCMKLNKIYAQIEPYAVGLEFWLADEMPKD